MSEQKHAQVITKGHRNCQIRKPNGSIPLGTQRPANDDNAAWKAYWEQLGLPWRTEAEISKDRQTFLAQCVDIKPDFKQDRYPFKNVRLSRADIEWLLGQEITNLILTEADLRGVDLNNLALERVNLDKAYLEEARLFEAHLEGASLVRTHLEGANLVRTHLEGADLEGAHLEQAYLGETHLEGASLVEAHLAGSDLDGAFFDINTSLSDTILGDEDNGFVSVIGAHWGGVDLSVIDWMQIKRLGDEIKAAKSDTFEGTQSKKKSSFYRTFEYRTAVRANRQLSVVLREQGLNEEANHFAYRAQVLQRKVSWYQMLQSGAKLRRRQRAFRTWFFSWVLFLVAGYGYKPERSFVAYIIFIFVFAIDYYVIGQTVGPHLSLVGSLVFSMTSFHGRGFFPGGIGLDDPLTVLAAFEAFVGLLTEVTFIASLTQRFFGK